MKLHYDPETDSLYIELKSTPGYAEAEIVEGLSVDLDDKDAVAGFDIDGFRQARSVKGRDDCASWARLNKGGDPRELVGS